MWGRISRAVSLSRGRTPEREVPNVRIGGETRAPADRHRRGHDESVFSHRRRRARHSSGRGDGFVTAAETRSPGNSSSTGTSADDSDCFRRLRGQQQEMDYLLARVKRIRQKGKVARAKVMRLRALQRESERQRQAELEAWRERETSLLRSESLAKEETHRCRSNMQQAEDQRKAWTSENEKLRLEVAETKSQLTFWQMQVQHLTQQNAGVEQVNRESLFYRQQVHQLQGQVGTLNLQLEASCRRLDEMRVRNRELEEKIAEMRVQQRQQGGHSPRASSMTASFVGSQQQGGGEGSTREPGGRSVSPSEAQSRLTRTMMEFERLINRVNRNAEGSNPGVGHRNSAPEPLQMVDNSIPQPSAQPVPPPNPPQQPTAAQRLAAVHRQLDRNQRQQSSSPPRSPPSSRASSVSLRSGISLRNRKIYTTRAPRGMGRPRRPPLPPRRDGVLSVLAFRRSSAVSHSPDQGSVRSRSPESPLGRQKREEESSAQTEEKDSLLSAIERLTAAMTKVELRLSNHDRLFEALDGQRNQAAKRPPPRLVGTASVLESPQNLAFAEDSPLNGEVSKNASVQPCPKPPSPTYYDLEDDFTEKRIERYRFLHEFTGKDPTTWIGVMNMWFRRRGLSEQEKYGRAIQLLGARVALMWDRWAHKYTEDWEGVQKFVLHHYGSNTAGKARAALGQVRWKGCTTQLMLDVEAAVNMCPEITEREKVHWFVGCLPDSTNPILGPVASANTLEEAYELAKKVVEGNDELKRANQEVKWGRAVNDGVRKAQSAGTGNEGAAADSSSPKSAASASSSSKKKGRGKHRAYGPCTHCQGRGHRHTNCPNTKGSNAPADAECYRCGGKGHFIGECTSPDKRKGSSESQANEKGAQGNAKA